MGRPKKSAVAKRNLPAVRSQRTVVDAVAQVKKFHELDLNDYSSAYLAKSDSLGASLTEWLASIGLSLDVLAEVADRRNGQPVMDATLIALWLETKTESCNPTATLKKYIPAAALWLRRNGWDTSRLDIGSMAGKNLRHATDSMCADKPKHIKTQARPYTPKEIDSIVAAIDANSFDWNDLTVQAMRTYVILGFAMAMRGGELCHTLRWSMVDVEGEVFNLPGGKVFKHQDKPATLTIPHNHPSKKACGTNCPVATLKAWKKTCEEHGIPTVDTLVFPAIRQKAAWNWNSTAAFFGDHSFIADPVAHSVALKGDTPRNRFHARQGQYIRYRKLWDKACNAAGITADHQWQRVSTHGMRRGAATTAVRNGIHEAIVSKRLRHNDIKTTSIYVQREAADTTSLNYISSTQNETLAGTETVTADDMRTTCEVTHNGVACGNDFACHIDIEGERVPACHSHGQRWRKGKTGDELTKPIRDVVVGSGATTCEVTHNGVACGNDFVAHIDIEGERVPACQSHGRRWRSGKTGDELTKPIKTRKAA